MKVWGRRLALGNQSIFIVLTGLLLGFVATSAAQSAAFVVGEAGDQVLVGQSLSPNMRFFVDKTKSMSLEQVIEKAEFKSAADTHSVGVGPSRLWLTFDLTNISDKPTEWRLEYFNHAAHFVNLHMRSKSSVSPWKVQEYRLFDGQNGLPAQGNRAVFPVKLAPKTSYQLMLSVNFSLSGGLTTDFRIWDVDSWNLRNNRENRLWGSFIAVFAFTGVVATVACIVGRSQTMLIYALYSFSIIFAYMSWAGMMQHPLGGIVFNWNWQTIPAGLAVAFGVWFSRLFLETWRHTPRLDWVMKFLVGLGFAQIPITLLANYNPTLSILVMAAIELSFLSYPIVVLAGILRWRQGSSEARLFTIAWGVYTCAVTAYALRDLGVIETTDFTYYLTPFGAVAEISLLTIALSLRVRELQLQKEEWQDRYREGLEIRRTELERLVELRTNELVDAREKAEHEARTDSLTDLPNRRYFMENGARGLSLKKRHEQSGSVILFDVDNFKQLNDSRGHGGGDVALSVLGDVVRSISRSEDVCGRVGGEEFAIFCPQTDLEDAMNLAERLRDTVEKTQIEHDGQRFALTISVGVAEAEISEDLEDVMRRADEALYVAKQSGKNTCRRHRGLSISNRL